MLVAGKRVKQVTRIVDRIKVSVSGYRWNIAEGIAHLAKGCVMQHRKEIVANHSFAQSPHMQVSNSPNYSDSGYHTGSSRPFHPQNRSET